MVRTRLPLLFLLAVSLSACYTDNTDVTTRDTGSAPPPDVVYTTVADVRVANPDTPLDDATITGLTTEPGRTINGELTIDAGTLPPNGGMVTVATDGNWPENRFLLPAGDGQFIEPVVPEPKVRAGSIDPATGGRIDLAANFSVEIPAGAVVTTADGQPYDGPIEVFINHDAPEDGAEMLNSPGNAPARMPDGSLANLESLGMMDIALESPGGDPLELAAGSEAEVRMPLEAATADEAPATAPFWVLDTDGFWQDAGVATLGDNCYVVYVRVSGGYNVDIPHPGARFCGRLVDANGNPLTHTAYSFHLEDGWSCWNARTDCNGEFCALVAAETALEIYVTDSCSNEVFTIPVGPLTAETDFDAGDITIDIPSVAFPIAVSSCDGGTLPAETEVWVNGYGGRAGRYIGYNADGSGFVSIPDCGAGEVVIQSFTPDYRASTRIVTRGSGEVEVLETCPDLGPNESFSLTIGDEDVPVSELGAIYWPENGDWDYVLRAAGILNGEEYSLLMNLSSTAPGTYAAPDVRLVVYRLAPGQGYGENLQYVDPLETISVTITDFNEATGTVSGTISASVNLQNEVAQTVDRVNIPLTATFSLEL